MLPEKVHDVIKRLNDNGFEAYAVGGCVRDSLRGETPADFDVATSALPEECKKVFYDKRVIETGIAHGTITLLWEGEPFEITTFRCDGEYKDSRHPDSVSFTKSIEEDLSRRDFTVNSMAMGRNGEIIDPYGGRYDLEKRLVRCTGEPDKRFGEDALRIMRALRFASVLNFEIEKNTAESVHKNKDLIKNVSVERIFVELKKLLCGKGVYRILNEYSDVICTVIPELAPSVGFEHKSKYHLYDVYTHIIKAVAAVEPDPTLRLALLFHDIGKPYSFTEEDGVRHFKGHPEESEKIARKVLLRLHADNKTIESVCALCKYHDRLIEPTEKSVRRLLMKLPYETFVMLCKVRIADSSAHNPAYGDRGNEALKILELAEKIDLENQCFKLRDLAVNGNDMVSLGFYGPQIGTILNKLLNDVVDEKLPNEKKALLEAARRAIDD